MLVRDGSEQVELARVAWCDTGGSPGVEEPMGGDEHVELAGVVADTFGKTRAGQHLVEGVSDVFQVAVEVVAVAREEVLQALEQVAREEPFVSCRA